MTQQSQPMSSQESARRPDAVLDLEAATDRATAGGKASSLARAARAGHPVPAGFVVTAPAAAVGARAIAAQVETALSRLGDGPFAVRSSAVAEDGAARSFAGQLETELDVPRAEVLAAVERCWASAASLRALRYAGEGAGPTAVLVQRMVPADAAGVAFSADPKTGERGVTIIEAVRGLGDRLVSGAVTPERWRVSASGADRGRGAEEVVLSEASARRVAALAREQEELFGAPQDIEWAMRGDDLFLLQSRPITALPAAPVPIPVSVPKGGWDRDDHHAVLSPLGWVWFQPYPKAMGAVLREQGMPLEGVEAERIGGHLYLRFVMGGGDSQKLPPRWVLWLASRLVPSLRRANRMAERLLDEALYLGELDHWESIGRPDMRRRIDALFVEDPSRLTDEELLDHIGRALDLSAHGLALHARLGGALFGVGKLVLFLEDKLGWPPDRSAGLVVGSSEKTTELHQLIEGVVREHRDEIAAAGGFPRSWAQLAARCPALGRALVALLAEHRLRVFHYDPKHPTLGERPDYFFAIAEAVAHGVEAEGELQHTREQSAALESEALREAAERLSPEDVAELRTLITQGRRAYASRDENGIETVSRPSGLLRHFVLELGRRIEHVIGSREHAVYLYPDEHRAALSGTLPKLAELVDRRRGEESWANQNRGPKRYGPPQGPMPPADAFPRGLGAIMRIMAWAQSGEALKEPGPGGELLGTGIGTRVVTGKARVVERPDELRLARPGEVVVCRITSPEWSVGLAHVAALVTNEGGALSHPAIIAREYGMTAVLGVEDATRRITTGDQVRVDPIAGVVTVLSSSSSAAPAR